MAARKHTVGARGRAGLLILAPALFLALSCGMALAIFLRNSFYTSEGMGIVGNTFTLRNYERLLDVYYLEVLIHTVFVSVVVVIVSAIISYPLALLISRPTSRRAGIFLLIVLASSAMSLVVRALGWIGILNDNGPANQLLVLFDLVTQPVQFLGGDFAIIIGLAHGSVPLFVLTLIPVLHSIDPFVEQAAAGLGASRMTILRTIIIPLSMPGIVAASLLTFALCMGAYTTPAILAGGRATTFPMLVQQQVMTVLNYPMGAVLAFALLVLVLAIIWTSMAATRRVVYAGA